MDKLSDKEKTDLTGQAEDQSSDDQKTASDGSLNPDDATTRGNPLYDKKRGTRS